MRLVFAILLSLTLISGTPTKNDGCLEIDVILLFDFSGSVEGFQPFIADAIDAFVDRFELSDYGIRIGIVGFHSVPMTISPLTSDKSELHRVTNMIRFSEVGGATNMADGLYLAKQELDESERKVRKLIILISDGAPTTGNFFFGNSLDSPEKNALVASQEIKNLGYGICGVLIESPDMDRAFMSTVVIDGCYVESSYELLAQELEQLDLCF